MIKGFETSKSLSTGSEYEVLARTDILKLMVREYDPKEYRVRIEGSAKHLTSFKTNTNKGFLFGIIKDGDHLSVNCSESDLPNVLAHATGAISDTTMWYEVFGDAARDFSTFGYSEYVTPKNGKKYRIFANINGILVMLRYADDKVRVRLFGTRTQLHFASAALPNLVENWYPMNSVSEPEDRDENGYAINLYYSTQVEWDKTDVPLAQAVMAAAHAAIKYHGSQYKFGQ